MGAQVIALSAKVSIGQMDTNHHATNFDKYLHTFRTPNAICFKTALGLSSDTWRKDTTLLIIAPLYSNYFKNIHAQTYEK